MKTIVRTLLESVKKTKEFEEKYDLSLPKDVTNSQLSDLKKAFSYLPESFIKHHIKKITFKDLGAIHGRYIQERKKGDIIINPSIFENKKYFSVEGKKIPVKYFTIVHEIGHMIDHLNSISNKKEWIDLSGWKELDKNKSVPKGFKRYVEKRSGRDIPGHKKSEWIHKEDAEFVRNYASKNPKEDFADTFSFIVLGKNLKFQDKGNKKVDIIKNLLNKHK